MEASNAMPYGTCRGTSSSRTTGLMKRTFAIVHLPLERGGVPPRQVRTDRPGFTWAPAEHTPAFPCESEELTRCETYSTTELCCRNSQAAWRRPRRSLTVNSAALVRSHRRRLG